MWIPRSSDAIFVLTFVLVCGLSVFIGVAEPLGNFAHDTFFFLDSAYRVTQGQIPHRDFSSAWGPLIFLIDATGLWLSGMKPAAFGIANALFGAVLAIWAFVIVRLRWPSAYACVIGIYTLLLITGPFPIGLHSRDFGYAMSYNRYGYALFGIIMMDCAADMGLARFAHRLRTGGAVSTGVALGLLFFLKVSYGLVAAPFVGALMIFGSAGRLRRVVGMCSGFAIVSLLVLCYLRFDIADMWQDLAMAATSRRLSLEVLHSVAPLDLVQAALIIAFAAGLIAGIKVSGERVARLHGALFGLLTLGAGYLLLTSNQQSNTFPLNGYAAVAFIAVYEPLLSRRLLKWPGVSPDFPKIAFLAVCILPFFFANALGLTSAAVERVRPLAANVIPMVFSESGTSLLFHVLTGPLQTETGGAAYVAAVNDGATLLRRHLGARDGVLTFDEFNPFNYLLARPSPRGGLAAAAYDYIFSDAAHPSAERFFGNAAWILVRKYKPDGPETANVSALTRLYGADLRLNFTMVEETEHWTLWQRAELHLP